VSALAYVVIALRKQIRSACKRLSRHELHLCRRPELESKPEPRKARANLWDFYLKNRRSPPRPR